MYSRNLEHSWVPGFRPPFTRGSSPAVTAVSLASRPAESPSPSLGSAWPCSASCPVLSRRLSLLLEREQKPAETKPRTRAPPHAHLPWTRSSPSLGSGQTCPLWWFSVAPSPAPSRPFPFRFSSSAVQPWPFSCRLFLISRDSNFICRVLKDRSVSPSGLPALLSVPVHG